MLQVYLMDSYYSTTLLHQCPCAPVEGETLMERALCQLIVRSKSSRGMRGPYSSRCVQRQLFLPVLLALLSYTGAVAEDA